MSQSVLSAVSATLHVRDRRGRYQVASAEMILSAARQVIETRYPVGVLFDAPAAVKDYLQAKLVGLDREVFSVLFLNSQNRLLAYEELFQGTLSQTSVYPREVVREALRINAAAVIFSHNHPSGEARPSRADETLTQTLKAALALIDVRVLDHIIVAADKTCSMAEMGLV